MRARCCSNGSQVSCARGCAAGAAPAQPKSAEDGCVRSSPSSPRTWRAIKRTWSKGATTSASKTLLLVCNAAVSQSRKQSCSDSVPSSDASSAARLAAEEAVNKVHVAVLGWSRRGRELASQAEQLAHELAAAEHSQRDRASEQRPGPAPKQCNAQWHRSDTEGAAADSEQGRVAVTPVRASQQMR